MIRTVIQRVDNYQAGTRRFYGMSDDQLRAMPVDTAFRLMADMWVPATFQFSQGALATATAAEGARLIGDGETWRALSRLRGELVDFEERFQLLADASQRVGEHPLQQTRYLGDRSTLPESVDLRGVRNYTDLLAAASAMQQNREIYLLYLRRCSDSIDRTVALITDRP